MGLNAEDISLTIDGRGEAGNGRFKVIDPAIGLPFAEAPDASQEQLEAAVAAARRAYRDWSAQSWTARHDAVNAFADGLLREADRIAPVLTREQGKPLDQARREIIGSAERIKMLGSLEVSDAILRDDARSRIVLRYKPLGVVAAITPWNVPVNMAVTKIAHALLTGNTVVLKPSPYTPLSTLMLGTIVRETLPPGVVNILSGGNALGAWLSSHAGVDKISFTGSVATGKHILAAAAERVKRVTLELGGNDAAIIMSDCDIDRVARQLFVGAFYNCGQTCMAIKRLYAHDAVHDRLCEALADIARAVRVGPGLDAGVEMGPLQNRMQYDKVLGLIAGVRSNPNGRILAGGAPLDRPGYFIAPTVVAGLTDGATLVDEEQFGPVLPVIRWSDLDDVVERANGTRYGLSASVWTADPDTGAQVAGRLEAGTVWINNHLSIDADIPFGGAKESGLGREYSRLGLEHYMEPVVLHGPARR